MAMLDHWHPVLPAVQLGKKPVPVKLAGQPIALFRTSTGQVGALNDVCPHRRMKLSYGDVVDDKLMCRYHGWTFNSCGQGESPGTPKMTACTTSFDTHEEHGYIWLKSSESKPAFPNFETKGYAPIGWFQHTIPAPLEVALDNFTEIEHTATVHKTFGYDLKRMHEVKVNFEPTDNSVRIVNVGPSMKINPIFSTILNIRNGDLFHDDWTTYFSPVYTVFDHWWTSPDGARESMVKWRLFIFFSPIDDKTTSLATFGFVKSRYPGPLGGVRLVKWLMRWQIDEEIKQDIEMLKHLADPTVAIEGMKLSRFDRVLGLTRERIGRIYRGEKTTPLSISGVA